MMKIIYSNSSTPYSDLFFLRIWTCTVINSAKNIVQRNFTEYESCKTVHVERLGHETRPKITLKAYKNTHGFKLLRLLVCPIIEKTITEMDMVLF